MVAKPPLELATENWNRRIASVRAYGLSPAPAITIAKTDLQRVAQGSQPITDQEALSQLTSVYTGQSLFQKQPATHHIWDILANAGSDIRDLIQNFPEGVAKTAMNVVSPSKWEELAGLFGHESGSQADRVWRQQHGFDPHAVNNLLDFHDWTAGARDLNKTVVGSLLPGLWTLGSTNKQKLQHPVQSLLDLLPFVAEGTKIATAGFGVVTAADAAKMTEAGIDVSKFKIAPEGSALESLAGGHPFGSLWRGQARPVVFRAFGIEGSQFDPLVRKTGLFVSRNKRVLANEMNDLYTKAVQEGIIPDGLSREAGQELLRKHMLYNINDKHDPAFEVQHGKFNRWLVDVQKGKFSEGVIRVDKAGNKVETGDQMIEIPTGKGTSLPYPAESAPVKAYQDSQAKAAAHATAREEFRRIVMAEAHANQEAASLPRTLLLDGTESEKPGLMGVLDAASSLVQRMRQMPDLPKRTQDALKATEQAITNTDGLALRDALNRLYATTGLNSGIYGSERFSRYANYLVKEIRQATRRGMEYDRVARNVRDASARAQEALARLDTTRQASIDAEAKFYKTLDHNRHPSYDPALREVMRGQLVDKNIEQYNAAITAARNAYVGAELDAVSAQLTSQLWDSINVLRTTKDWHDVEKAMGTFTSEELGQEVASKIREDLLLNWRDMIDRGYRPLFVSNVDPAAFERLKSGHITPIPGTYYKPEYLKRQAFDFSPGVQDIAVALTDTAFEAMRDMGTAKTVEYMGTIGAYRPAADIINELTKAFSTTRMVHRTRDPETVDLMVRDELDRIYSTYDPKNPNELGRRPSIPDLHHPPADLLLMPKGMNTLFNQLFEQDGKLPGHGLWAKGMGLYKFSTLTGPRHFVHVTVGSLVMMMLREPMAAIRLREAATTVAERETPGLFKVGQALRIFKAHSTQLPEAGAILQHDVWEPAYLNSEIFTSAVHQYSLAQTVGRLFRESHLARGINAFRNLEGMIADSYRVAVQLQAKAEGATVEEALTRTMKTFVDMDNLTPFERTVVRNYLPFWAFTKHILRFALTYPADHPVRAAILSAMVRQLEAEHLSGEPDRFMQLFHLGTPDASGNITTIDIRNINPFRSMATAFTMAGFVQGLNPIAQEALHALGVDPLSGTPELYPKLSLNDMTGGLQAKRPGVNLGRFATEVVPEFGILDHFIQFSDRMKILARYNPESYRRELFSTLNLPFSIATTNIYGSRARVAGAQYKVAQQATSEAMKSGDPSKIAGYENVPFSGAIYPTSIVQDYIRRAAEATKQISKQTGIPDLSPKAVITTPRPKRRRRRRR